MDKKDVAKIICSCVMTIGLLVIAKETSFLVSIAILVFTISSIIYFELIEE